MATDQLTTQRHLFGAEGRLATIEKECARRETAAPLDLLVKVKERKPG
jgi:hypothetical protein